MEVNALQERVTEQEEFNSKGFQAICSSSSRWYQRTRSQGWKKRKENDDTSKNVKELERKYKEAVMVLEEDRKFLARQQEEYECNQIKARKIEFLQNKITSISWSRVLIYFFNLFKRRKSERFILFRNRAKILNYFLNKFQLHGVHWQRLY